VTPQQEIVWVVAAAMSMKIAKKDLLVKKTAVLDFDTARVALQSLAPAT